MIKSFRKTLGELYLERRGPSAGGTRGRILCDSRQVIPGDVFVAIPGANVDGHDFIPQAEQARAQIILHQRELDHYHPSITYIQVSDSGCAYARLLREFYGRPDDSVRLLGVTGTNGKTTTAYLLEHLFRHAGEPCGLISTVEYRDGKVITESRYTTPDAGILYPLLATMRRNGMRVAALELSSHALQQGRVDGARFRAAIFTNLTGEHLDYHGDMEHYYQAKKRFFDRHLDPRRGVAVINIDDPYGRRLASELAGVRTVTFGKTPEADWRITRVELGSDSSRFRLESDERAFDAETNLIGEHNVYNLTGAILTALDRGISASRVNDALAFPIRVPGRLERIAAPSGADFYVDYAHTEDALANVLSILRKIARRRVIILFGAGGDRDTSKRPAMGRRAAELADELIVTSDNPRSEAPEEIIRQIVAGIPEGTRCQVEPDRRKAIALAARLAEPGDIVLLAGKGHENYQEIAGTRYRFDDRAILKEFLGL